MSGEICVQEMSAAYFKGTHDGSWFSPPAGGAGGRRKRKRGPWLALCLLVIACGLLRMMLRHDVVAAARVAAVEPLAHGVDLVTAKPDTSPRHLDLTSELKPYSTMPVFAPTAGTLAAWRVDTGAHVEKGEVLATIESPGADSQSVRAGQDGISSGTSLAAAGQNHGAASAVTTKPVVAPADGVVTARRGDIGAAVLPGDHGGSPLFKVDRVDKLRATVHVPQLYAGGLRQGMAALLKFPQYPGRVFDGAVEATSMVISDKSRTFLAELVVDNTSGLLLPGSFAHVVFLLPANPDEWDIPRSAIVFREGVPEVATVGSGGLVRLKPIEIVRDDGMTADVTGDLSRSDRVIKDPADSVESADRVQVMSLDGNPIP